MNKKIIGFAAAGLSMSAGLSAKQIEPMAPQAVRGAHYPTLSPDGRQLCFEYKGDLWMVPSSGGSATRLTVHPAYDAYPRWSPDGNWIAFSSNRTGNFDIFLVPARGGEAKQITTHSADDIVLDWSPDGSQLLFQSNRDGRYTDLYTITVKDHVVRKITNDRNISRYGVFSPDGKTVAYARGRQEWWRPLYKGSASSDIYTVPSTGGRSVRITNTDSYESFPFYSGKDLYFLAHKDGSTNLYRLPGGSSIIQQVTNHTGAPVRYPTISRDGSTIAYERDFQIYTLKTSAFLNPKAPQLNSVAVGNLAQINIAADMAGNNLIKVNLTSGGSGLSLTEDGRSFAFVARGEVFTLPSTGGDATKVTSTHAAQYSPTWSSDGSSLAYVSDRNGNLDIYMQDVKTKKETQITFDPADETNPKFAPGGGPFLTYIRTGGPEPGLYSIPIAKDKAPTKSDPFRLAPGTGINSYDWSPDGRWIVFSQRDKTGTSDLWIVSSAGGEPINVTRFPGTNTQPKWSRDGKNIVFLSNRGGIQGQAPANIYVLPLMPDLPRDDDSGAGGAPRNPSSDDQVPDAQRRRQVPTGQAPANQAPQQQPGFQSMGIPQRATLVRIEFDDIQNRARALTNTRDTIIGLNLSPDARSVIFGMNSGGSTDWYAADVVSGANQKISTGGNAGGTIDFSPDGSRFFYISPNGQILTLSRMAPTISNVAFSATMVIDRKAEVAEAFNEAWRNLRTQFYDPKMHGVNWLDVRDRYASLLPHVAAKEDFAYLLQSMIGELNASHTGATAPPNEDAGSVTGYLGATFDPDYSGPGWKVTDIVTKGPLDQVGRKLHRGDYILSIDGIDLNRTEEALEALRDKVGKTVTLVVNEQPTTEKSRTIKVRPINKAAIDDLDYENWVANRRKKVEALSAGRLAYIHIRAMDQPSLLKFQREIFGDAQRKEGLVLDVRFNGGGRIHDDLLSVLTRKPHVYETPRDAEKATQPFQLWNKPTSLLINEFSASDAEIFPNGFREFKLGPIVGVPTYGGVIGTVDITLVDGTRFRIPRTGWTTLDGRNLENWGVPPDVRVELSPEDYATDNDKQLEAAVKAVLKSLPPSP